MVLSCTKGALHNHPPLQLSVQNLWFHQEGGWYSLLLLLLGRMLTCGYRSPLPAPLHLALQRETPPPPCRYPPHPCCLALICTFHTQPCRSPRNQHCRLCCLVFSVYSWQGCIHVIQNLGQAADGYNVQSVEVRSCREFEAGFDLHKLVQTPARCAFT